jgi:hypothetical protein
MEGSISAASSKPVVGLKTRISASDVVTHASNAIFGKPLVVNVWRALLVESLIDLILPPEWTWCATDYAGWDFHHIDRTRLEVKQSAARQSWKASGSPCSPRFDIKPRTGAWDGADWIRAAEPMRHADLYLLAYHPVTDDTADHRDPHQWEFHVISTVRLPATQSISLAAARRIAAPIGYAEVAATVESTRRSLKHDRNADRPPPQQE